MSPRDRKLPGLAAALDPEQVRSMLAPHHALRGERLETAKVQSVQYRPGRRAALTWALRVRPEQGGRSRRRWAAVLVHPPGEAPRGRPVATDERLGFCVYVYPEDPWLPGLARAHDRALMRDALAAVSADLGLRPKRVAVERLGYTPFARAALGVDVVGETPGSGMPHSRRLVAKLDAQRSAAQLFARNWAVWRAARPRLALVPPVTMLPGLDAFVQERLAGDRLSDLAADPRLVKWTRQTARAVAAFHRLELPLRGVRSGKREAATVHRWGRLLETIRPESEARIRRTCANVAAALERDAMVTGTIHADLHPANLLVCGEQVHLIDIDNVTLGDRALDAGRFLSALRTTSFRLHGRADGLADAGQAFLDAFMAACAEREYRVRLFEAACLVVSAATGFRLQRENWRESADLLLEAAERALQRYRDSRGPALACMPPAPARKVRWAMDRTYMRAVLADPVRDTHGVELNACRVTDRGPSGRRHRFRYHLSGKRNGASWRRTCDAHLRSDRCGRGAARRVRAASRAMTRCGSTLVAAPLAFVPEISLRVNETLCGTKPFPPRSPEDRTALAAAERMADELAQLSASSIDLDRELPVRSLRRQLVRAAERAVARDVVGSVEAGDLLRWIDEQFAVVPHQTRPALRRVDPAKLRLVESRLVLIDVDDVVLAPPGFDAADLVARWTITESDGGGLDGTAAVRRRFTERYLQATGIRAETFDALRAVAAFRLIWGDPRADAPLTASRTRAVASRRRWAAGT